MKAGNNANRGYLLALTAGILWAILGVLGKVSFGYGADPLTVVTLRAIIAFATLFVVLIMVNRKFFKIRRKDLLFFTLFGLIGVTLNYSSYFYAIKLTSVSTAALLLYTYPAFVVVFSAYFFHEKIDAIKIFALLFIFLGCLLITNAYNLKSLKLNYSGILCGITAALTAAIYNIFGKKALQNYDSQTVVFYAFGFGALFLLFIRDPRLIFRINFSLNVWIIILILAWIPTLLAYFLYISSLKYIEAGRASIVSTIEPVAAPLLAYIFLKETMSYVQILGAFLILVSVITIRFSQIRLN
ncbi:MAG: EamA family transporter [Candidatus Aerophobetes bacterium]|nr:EamA family transporter [Candidatus Aerophobetes bacterium]